MNLDNVKLKNKDSCLVSLYIIENNLSTALPACEEDIETLCYHNIIEYDYTNKKYQICYRDSFQEFQDRFAEYRNLFHKDSIGISGKNSSPKAVMEKLEKFHKEFPEYTMQELIDAAKLHIQETKPMYIKKANNFLFKKEGNSVWESVASEYILRLRENVVETQNNFL